MNPHYYYPSSLHDSYFTTPADPFPSYSQQYMTEYTSAQTISNEYSIPTSYQGWQWDCQSPPHSHPLTHSHSQLHDPVTILPGPSSDPPPFYDLSSSIKSAFTPQNYPLRSPTAQLPTPAAMSVLLNPNGHARDQTTQVQAAIDVACLSAPQLPPPPPSSIITGAPVDAVAATAVMPVPDILSREKKHACTMCHKRFDRPSTLRKHLLVHTGEKAFVCETCGRRFGVASNLNRHVRRCILKPVNAAAAAAAATSSSSSSSSPSATPLSHMSADRDISVTPKSGAQLPKRGRATSSSTGSTSTSSSSPTSSNYPSTTERSGGGASGTNTIEASQQRQPGQKRRRRAPSPSLWIPWSLRAFNLNCEEFYRSAPVPLPPVRRNLPKEERDSWDENVSSRPYHPQEWKGVLPGPGLGHGIGLSLGGNLKDVRNIDFGGGNTGGGIVLGRVLVC